MNRSIYNTSLIVTGLALSSLASTSCAGQSGWSVQQGTGFQVSTPRGWSAEGAKDGHTLIHNADRSVFALVQPFRLGEGAAGETIAPLINHMSSLFPNSQVSAPKQVSTEPDEAIARVSFDSGKEQANVLSVLSNGRGMLYAIAAPSGEFHTERNTLIQILRSFKYEASGTAAGGGNGHTGAGSVSFEQWTEPHESAFTTEVPQGWHVIGGSYRFAPVDVRTQVSVVSPDGSIVVQNGAAKLTTFALPGPSSQMRGLHNGQQYNVNGLTYTVMPYWSGSQLAKEFAELKLKKDHPGLEITSTKERPDLEEFVNRKLQAAGGGGNASTGETDFRFNDHGRELVGACVGTTIQIGRGGSAIWLAFPSYIIAPADEMDTAWKVWQRLILGRKDNPEWTSKQHEITERFNQMVMQNHEAVMQQLQQQYQQASRNLDENFRVMDNIINGEEDVRNPNTGATAKVAAGSNYYWGRADGAVVGTNTYNPPDINFTPLERF